MIVENILLPRFLILELVLACHFFQFTRACNSILTQIEGSGDEDEEGKTSFCQIDIDNVGWKYQPLFLTPDREWMYPGGGRTLRIDTGHGVLLSCPGSRVNRTTEASLELTCTQGRLRQEEDDVRLDHVGCEKNPRDRERLTGLSCGPDAGGELVEVGFHVEDVFRPLLFICHNKSIEHTYFAQHTLRGALVQHNNNEEGRPSFKEGQLFFKTVSANSLYMKRNQNLLFQRLLGAQGTKQLLTGNYLARGHLAPDADFLYKDWQELTYYYGNVAPQWQSINNGNWKRLEFKVREKADKSDADLDIRTGTFGIMSGYGDRVVQDVWLSSKQDQKLIPVPEYFFKVISDLEKKESIGVFCTNNPSLPRISRSAILCTDVCDLTGWGEEFNNRRQVEDGVLFCCSPEEMGQLVPWAVPLNIAEFSTLHF